MLSQNQLLESRISRMFCELTDDSPCVLLLVCARVCITAPGVVWWPLTHTMRMLARSAKARRYLVRPISVGTTESARSQSAVRTCGSAFSFS